MADQSAGDGAAIAASDDDGTEGNNGASLAPVVAEDAGAIFAEGDVALPPPTKQDDGGGKGAGEDMEEACAEESYTGTVDGGEAAVGEVIEEDDPAEVVEATTARVANDREEEEEMDGGEDEEEEEEDATAIAARQASVRLNDDALLSTLESDYVSLRSERDDLRARLDAAGGEAKELRSQLTAARSEAREKEGDARGSLEWMEREKAGRVVLEREATAQAERVDRMEAETDLLRKDISRLTQSSEQYAFLLAQAQTEHSLSTSSALPLKLEVARLKQELDATNSHARWMDSELVGRNERLAEMRSSHSGDIRSLRVELDRTKAEMERAQNEGASSKTNAERTAAELEKVRLALRDERLSFAEERMIFETDLEKERSLVSLKEQRVALADDQKEAMSREVEELRVLAKEATEESASNAEELRATVHARIASAVEEVKEEEGAKLAELEERLGAAEEAKRIIEEDVLNVGAPSRRRQRALMAAGDTGLLALPSVGAPGTSGGEGGDGPLGLTDLYARLSDTEDDLRAEQVENKKLRIIIERIRMDVERQTPVVRRKQVELEQTLEDLDDANERLEHARREASDARADAQDIEVQHRHAERACHELSRENVDLATQVQRLLQSRMATERGDAGTKDEDSFAFDSIQTLQQQNQKLLRNHHNLTDKINELEEKIRSDPERVELERLRSEVASLREEREKQSKLVAGLVHQRDLYRALVAKNDSSLASKGAGDDELVMADARAERLPAIETENRTLTEDVSKLRAEASVSKHEVTALEGRLARIDAHAEELITSNAGLRGDLTATRAAVARTEIDASHYRERCERLGGSVEAMKQAREAEVKRRTEMNELNFKLQELLEAARSEASRKEQQYQQFASKLRLAEAQLQTAKSAEERIAYEANSLRSELAQQGALLASVQRIEASLTAKTEEEGERLREEVKRLQELLSDENSKHSEIFKKLEGKISELELVAKAASAEKQEAIANVSKAKEDASQSRALAGELSNKCSSLEKELHAAKRKLGDTSIDTSEEDALKEKVSTLTSERDATKAELETVKSRIADYQKIAKAGETEVSGLTSASTRYREKTTVELEKLKADLVRVRQSEQAKNEAITEMVNDLTSQGSDKEKAVNELKSQVDALQTELTTTKQDGESAVTRVNSLMTEMKTYQQDATNAQNNYERELALHAEARTALRNARSEAESEQRVRQTAESQLSVVKAEQLDQSKIWDEAKTKVEEALQESNTRLKDSRSQNNILHDQMISLSAVVDKFRSKKCSILLTESDAAGTEGEITSLRRELSDLRELVRFSKSECAMLEADLASSKRETERERASAAISKRSLDGARSELQLLQESGGFATGSISANESDLADLREKLKSAEEQLTLFRESNTMLREESQKVARKLSQVQSALDNAETAAAPQEAKIKDMDVEKASLESEKASLLREIDNWKNRVHSLVSKFNQIDPEEHSRALANIDTMRKECVSLKALKLKAEQDCTNFKSQLARLNKDISTQKASIDSLRNALSKMKSEKEKLTKSVQSGNAAANELLKYKEANKKIEQQLQTSKTELSAAQARIGNFRDMLGKVRLKEQNALVAAGKAKHSEEVLRKEIADLKLKLEKSETAAAENQVPPASQVVAPEKDVGLTVSAAQPPKPAEATHMAGVKDSNVAKDVEKKAQVATPASASTMPSVPPGGFKFAPSVLKKPAEQATDTPIAEKTSVREKKEETVSDTVKTEVASVVVKSGSTPKAPKIINLAGAKEKSSPAPEMQTSEELTKKRLLLKKRKMTEQKLASLKENKKHEIETPNKAATSGVEKTAKESDSPCVSDSDTKASSDPVSQVAPLPSGNKPLSPVHEIEETKATSDVKNEKKMASKPPPVASSITPSRLAFGSSTLVATSATTFDTSNSAVGSSYTAPASFFGSAAKTERQTAGGVLTGEVLIAAKPAFGSGAFLNLTPPGKSGTTAPFVFGKSPNITLTAPAGAAFTGATKSFGLFGPNLSKEGSTPGPFGGFGVQSKGQFGSAPIKKRSVEESIETGGAVKIARTEESNSAKGLTAAESEEGEIMDENEAGRKKPEVKEV